MEFISSSTSMWMPSQKRRRKSRSRNIDVLISVLWTHFRFRHESTHSEFYFGFTFLFSKWPFLVSILFFNICCCDNLVRLRFFAEFITLSLLCLFALTLSRAHPISVLDSLFGLVQLISIFILVLQFILFNWHFKLIRQIELFVCFFTTLFVSCFCWFNVMSSH
jgi:hypothetical protein